MTDHEQTAAGVALKPCPGFNPDLSSRGEGDCLNCGRHQSEHGAPTDAGGAVSEAVPDPWSHTTGWSAKIIDGKWRVGMTGNLDTVHDAAITVHRHSNDGEDARIAAWIASTYSAALSAPQPLQQGGEVTQAALIKALEPFALLAGYGDPENATVNLSDPIGKWLTFAQLHDAASVMNALTSPAHRQKDQPHD